MMFDLEKFNRSVTDQDLLKNLVDAHAIANKQSKSFTFRSYRKFGKFSPTTIVARFGSWNEGLLKAGLFLTEEKNIPVENLFDNLRLVWISKGKQPVYRDMSFLPSRYTGSTYLSRFGGWRKALEEFVALVDQDQSEILSYEIEVKSQKGTKRTNRQPSLSLRFLVLKRDRFCCVACGRSPATVPGLELEVDHIVAWANGGETIEENLQSLCFDCNRGKGVM